MMAETTKKPRKIVSKSQSHMPKDSVFYEKIIPILLAGMAVITVVLILFAIGVLAGIVQF